MSIFFFNDQIVDSSSYPWGSVYVEKHRLFNKISEWYKNSPAVNNTYSYPDGGNFSVPGNSGYIDAFYFEFSVLSLDQNFNFVYANNEFDGRLVTDGALRIDHYYSSSNYLYAKIEHPTDYPFLIGKEYKMFVFSGALIGDYWKEPVIEMDIHAKRYDKYGVSTGYFANTSRPVTDGTPINFYSHDEKFKIHRLLYVKDICSFFDLRQDDGYPYPDSGKINTHINSILEEID
jgi:hypothetical protein